MIHYATIGCRDLAASRRFYDAVLGQLSGEVEFETPTMVFYSNPAKSAMLAIVLPENGLACTAGNGSMFGLPAAKQETVDAAHAAAIAAGGANEGAPGFRTPEIYIAYFRDPEGNKLAVYHTPSLPIFFDGGRKIARQLMEAFAKAAQGG